ncbi:MAG: biopolymer transporter ExbD [Spirochaetales bacterium]|nr:biopolymer transporter ExbD [Spirochaetales bacterium]
MRFKRRLMPQANVDLVPMIDVVFQLVIFFMVSTTFILTPGINLVLPGSTTSEPVVMTKFVVTVISENEIYLNKDKFSLSGLDKKLETMTASEKNGVKTVVVEGDRAVSYDLMIKVLDVLRQNGFKGVNLKTRDLNR